MALDPRIALEAGAGVPQIDPAGSMMKGALLQQQQTANQYQPQVIEGNLRSQAANTNTTELNNDQLAREVATKKRLAQLAKANSSVDPKTGIIKIDNNAVAHQAAAEGMDPGVVFKFVQAGQERDAESLKQGTDKQTVADSVLNPTVNLLRVQQDPKQALAIAKAAHDQLIARGFSEEDATRYGQQKLGLSGKPPLDANGQPDPVAAGIHLIQQAKLAGAGPGGPSQAEMEGKYGENAQVTAFGKSLIAQGITDEDTLKGLTGKQIHDQFDAAAQSNQATGAQRIEGGKTAAAANSKLSAINDALSLEGDLHDNTGLTKLGTLTQKKWNDFVTQNPKYGRVQGAIDQYNIDHPGTNLTVADGLPTVFARLRQDQTAIKNLGQQGGAVASGSGGIAKATKAAAEPAAPSAPAAPSKPKLSDADLASHRQRAMAALQKGAPVSAVKKVFKEQTGQDL